MNDRILMSDETLALDDDLPDDPVMELSVTDLDFNEDDRAFYDSEDFDELEEAELEDDDILYDADGDDV